MDERPFPLAVLVEIADVAVELEWDGSSEFWRGTWDDTEGVDPGVYTYSVDVALGGDAIPVGTYEDEFRLIEQIGEVYDIEYLDYGETIEVPEDTSLLIAGEERVWNLPYNCRRGVCGRCTGKIDGDVNELIEMESNDVLPQELIDQGYTLTCQGYRRGEFALETDVYSEIRDEL